jgi:hypothetical protein
MFLRGLGRQVHKEFSLWYTPLSLEEDGEPVSMIVKSRYGLRYGNDLAYTDYQGLTVPPASCKSLHLLNGLVLSRR